MTKILMTCVPLRLMRSTPHVGVYHGSENHEFKIPHQPKLIIQGRNNCKRAFFHSGHELINTLAPSINTPRIHPDISLNIYSNMYSMEIRRQQADKFMAMSVFRPYKDKKALRVNGIWINTNKLQFRWFCLLWRSVIFDIQFSSFNGFSRKYGGTFLTNRVVKYMPIIFALQPISWFAQNRVNS